MILQIISQKYAEINITCYFLIISLNLRDYDYCQKDVI